jgi:hypothetical protein
MEKKHKQKAEASFALKEKYKKMQITHPTEVFASKDFLHKTLKLMNT